MFGRAILDKFPECIFQNFEIALGSFIPEVPQTKHVITG